MGLPEFLHNLRDFPRDALFLFVIFSHPLQSGLLSSLNGAVSNVLCNDEPIDGSGYSPTDRIDDLRRSGAETKWISAEPLIGPLSNLKLVGIDWLVGGGESGPLDDIREMKLGWIRDIIAQCRAQDTAVFVKQLGDVYAHEHGLSKKAGDPAEWPEDLRIREQPTILDDQSELG